MLKALVCLKLCFFLSCFALEEKPWFSDPFEFEGKGQYEFNFFSKVSQAVFQPSSTIYTNVARLGLGVTAPETYNWEAELELSSTKGQAFGYRSFAFQGRKLFLDDVCGDPVSVSAGIAIRTVSSRMLHAVSTPYHAEVNFEFEGAVGKEYSRGPCWFFRFFAVGAIGQAIRGNPWVRGDFFLLSNYKDKHQFRLEVNSYFGLGSKQRVDIDHFNGWAPFAHRSIDVGGGYRYCLRFYGTIAFDYLRRVYARTYPERVNFFLLTYTLPFSVL